MAPTRRDLFRTGGLGFGGMALASLLNREAFAATHPTHFPAKAKSVIFLCMTGAPSQLDLFDYKPELKRLHGTSVPESLIAGERFAFLSGVPKLLGTPFQFKQHGQSGTWVSEMLPQISTVVDDAAFIYSMRTDQFNHAPAEMQMFTGSPRPGRPSMGSWVTYGLGSDAEDLPGFVVLPSGRAGRCGAGCIGTGFLPTVYQGVQFRAGGDPVLSLSDPEGMSKDLRRASLDTIKELNQDKFEQCNDPEINTRIASFEMAYRMQSSVPDLMDISKEPKHIHELYGTEPGKKSFANNALLARRLVERGVRFVMLTHGEWDHHGGTRINLVEHFPAICREVDRASAALIKDLKQRGLLKDTLVVWGGEFGRTPMLQGDADDPLVGRDHHRSFTLWMAGGGVKAGMHVGSTDDLGYKVAEDPADVFDMQATILNQLGMDHKRLTYRYQGRDFRLTDVHGNVIQKLVS
ncbi:MAG: DUF1501 domain-containing protein [Bryobacteraceae bacterium]